MTNWQNLAIFDLDYTLTRKGTWGRFMWMCLKPYPWKWLPFLCAAGWTQWRYKQGHIPRIKVKEAMIRRSIKGWGKARLEKIAQDFADAEVPEKLRPLGLEQLQSHKDNGDLILIASAAADILVKPIARQLGIEDFVATDMGWTENECLEPEFATENCYGEEKLNRVKAWMKSKGLPRDKLHITTYSDSHADIPLFEFSDVAIAVHPSSKLTHYATEKDWQVVDWN